MECDDPQPICSDPFPRADSGSWGGPLFKATILPNLAGISFRAASNEVGKSESFSCARLCVDRKLARMAVDFAVSKPSDAGTPNRKLYV